jgi:cellulose synthase/poly-beta-1,6-N-acetylglucosamine synthase-like glycosyltransferase
VPPVLFAALIVQAFYRQGIAAWGVGIAYILYDTALLAFTAWQILPLRDGDAAPPPASDAARPSLAVIVAAKNESAVLAITIDTLAAQADPPDLILLADDGSTDDSAAVLARRYGLAAPALGGLSEPAPALPALRWLRLPHGGKARALNAAIQRIDHDLVLTVDADTLLAPGALKAMRDAFAAEPSLVAATGVLAPVCGPHLVGQLFQWFQGYEYVRNFLSRYAWMQQDGLLLISGAFAGFRRAAVIEVGGFDPESMVEDYELIHRLHRHAADAGLGWRVRVIGGALASTDAPASALGFLRQRRRWFGGFLQTQHWNRDMVGNRRYGRLGTRMLPVKALDTLQPIYGLAAFAILIGFVVTGRYRIALPILIVMIAKIAIDLSFHLWSLTLYKRWTGQREGLALGPAILASFAEPFSFQLLRHAGAAWGWIAFLRGRETWVRQVRTAVGAERASPDQDAA